MTKTGTLVLIKERCKYCTDAGKVHCDMCTEWHKIEPGYIFTPIIVCDDEIKEGDKVYEECKVGLANRKEIHTCEKVDKEDGWIYFLDENCKTGLGWCKKILVDTPKIPHYVIHSIIIGELKDGSQVEVELEFLNCKRDEYGGCIENPNCQDWVFNKEKVKQPINTGCDHRPHVTVTWNKEVKQSPLYTEKEVYTLVERAMQEGCHYDSEEFLNPWEWFENNKKK
jgi:hypothetical protein